jgi:galactokinase
MHDDAVAASAFGAGFGGSVWALVPVERAGALVAQWRERYAEAFPEHRSTAEFFLTSAGPPARRLV